MLIVFIACIFVVLVYSILIMLYLHAWKKQEAYIVTTNQSNVFVSIVIPARNEERNIEDILTDIKQQSYNYQLFEVILVNDHSTDQTEQVAERYKEQFDKLIVLALESGAEGKKQALAKAIFHAKGELIVTLDADCRIGENWLSTIANFYSHHKSRLIICPLLYYAENNLFTKMQSFENISLIASGAAAAALGRPILCNGANLAFSRETYMSEIENTKQHVASGDDIFLLLSVKKKWPQSIAFLKSTAAVAYTKPIDQAYSFLMQRKRWASKSKHYTDADILIVAAIVLGCSLAILLSISLAFTSYKFLYLFLLLFCLKSVPDYLLLRSFSRFFAKAKLLKYFVITQLIYPLFIVIMAIYGSFGRFEWKKRIYK